MGMERQRVLFMDVTTACIIFDEEIRSITGVSKHLTVLTVNNNNSQQAYRFNSIEYKVNNNV